MRVAILPSLLAALACGSATAAPSSEPTDPIRQRWEALRASGCDLAGVWTPVEARILRNTPFAIAGLKLADADLASVFTQDGGWYRPNVSDPPKLPPADEVCVGKLAAREAGLRKRWAIPPEMEARMTRDHAIVEVLRGWGRGPANPYGVVRFLQDPDGAWRVFVTVPGCDPPAECPGYTVRCPVSAPCEPSAAG